MWIQKLTVFADATGIAGPPKHTTITDVFGRMAGFGERKGSDSLGENDANFEVAEGRKFFTGTRGKSVLGRFKSCLERVEKRLYEGKMVR